MIFPKQLLYLNFKFHVWSQKSFRQIADCGRDRWWSSKDLRKAGPSTTQLLVRVQDVAQQAALEAEPLPLGAFTMTTVTAVAAVPNLLAEVLHPESHWSHELDNRL